MFLGSINLLSRFQGNSSEYGIVIMFQICCVLKHLSCLFFWQAFFSTRLLLTYYCKAEKSDSDFSLNSYVDKQFNIPPQGFYLRFVTHGETVD